MHQRKSHDQQTRECERTQACEPTAAEEEVGDRTSADIVRRVCAERGVTAEEVLAAIFDTLAEDYLHLHTPDEQALETPAGILERVPPAVTALAFRRLMQRLCAQNLKAAEREEDDDISAHEWMNAMMAGDLGEAQAAAVEAFDGASLVAARQIEQAKYEAEVMGKPDPYPHIQFPTGSTKQVMSAPPADRPAAPAAPPRRGGRAEQGQGAIGRDVVELKG